MEVNSKSSVRMLNLFAVEIPTVDAPKLLARLPQLEAHWLAFHRPELAERLCGDFAHFMSLIITAKSDGSWLFSEAERNRPFTPEPLIEHFKSCGLHAENLSFVDDVTNYSKSSLVDSSEIAIFKQGSNSIFLFPDVSHTSPLLVLLQNWLADLSKDVPSAKLHVSALSPSEHQAHPENSAEIEWCRALVETTPASDLHNLVSPVALQPYKVEISRPDMVSHITKALRISVCSSRMAEFFSQTGANRGWCAHMRSDLHREISHILWQSETTSYSQSFSKRVAASYLRFLRETPKFLASYGEPDIEIPEQVLQLRKELVAENRDSQAFPNLSGKLGVSPEEVFFGYHVGLPKWHRYADSLAEPLSQKAFWNYAESMPASSIVRSYVDRKGISLK